MTFAKPTSVPSASRSAVMTTLAQKREPSLRTRQPSSSKRPFAGRDLELALGLARRDVLGRIEDREVLADDLVGLVALDALGARRSRSRRARRDRA